METHCTALKIFLLERLFIYIYIIIPWLKIKAMFILVKGEVTGFPTGTEFPIIP